MKVSSPRSRLLALAAASLLVLAAHPGARAADQTLKVAYSVDFVPLTPEAGAKLWADIIADFEKENPGVKVEAIKIPGDYGQLTTKLGLLFRSPDTAPDLAEVPNQDIVQWIESGFFADISDLVANDPAWKGMPDSVKAETTFDGKVYSISRGENNMALMYDKVVFRKAGIPLPWQPKTWDDVLNAARKVKASDHDVWPLWVQTGTAQGSLGASYGPDVFLFASSDPTIYDTEENKWVVDSKGIRDTIEFYKTAAGEGLLAPASQILNANAVATPSTEFPKHHIGLGVIGNYVSLQWTKQVSAPAYPQASEEIAVVPLPTKSGQAPGASSALSGWGSAIYANTKKRDLAWKFAKVAESKKNLIATGLANGQIPPVTEIANSKEWLDIDPFQKPYNDVLPLSKGIPLKSGYTSWAMGLMTATEAVVLDPKLSVDDAVAKMSDYVSNQLSPDVIEVKK